MDEGRKSGQALLSLWVGLGVMAADQLTKFWLVKALPLFGHKVIVPGLFNLVHVLNTGAAFGILAGRQTWQRQVFFTGVALAALVALAFAWRYFRNQGPLYVWAIGLIGGGAVGNVIDRLRLGAVIDFLDFYLGSWHWPAFNVADSAITVGVGLFFLAGFWDRDGEQEGKDKS